MTQASPMTHEVRIERTIPAAAGEVFDAWLDPKIPGTPFHAHEKLILNPVVDGLWYWRSLGGTPHYGRFVELAWPGRIQYSWMSPNTLGQESTVTVTFAKQGDETLMTLTHSGLPNEAMANAHEKGWTSISDKFREMFAGRSP